MTSIIANKLQQKQRYKQQIDALYRKYQLQHRLYDIEQDNVDLASFALHGNQIAQSIVKTIAEEAYEFQAVKPREVNMAGKLRTIYPLAITDRVVQGVLYQILNENMDAVVPPCVYSYIKGRTPHHAIEAFSQYLRQHQKFTPNQHIDLYVLRTDITNYTDSIPLFDTAPVWSLLEKHIETIEPMANVPAYIKQLINNAVRPPVRNEEGLLFQHCVGIPMGLPLCSLVAVLYLQDADNALANIDGAFYARFGDDLLFAHPNPEVVLQADQALEEILVQLGLSRNRKKDEVLYLTKAGRPSDHSAFQGRHYVEYLGYRIDASANYSLRAKRLREFLLAIKKRIRTTAELTRELSFDERGKALCQAVNESLNIKNPSVEPYYAALLSNTNQHGTFQHLDYLIALAINRSLTGIRGPQSFRKVPFRRLREEWGLISLSQLKNQHHRAKPHETY